MKKLNETEIMDLLEEWIAVTNTLTEVKNPFIYMATFQLKMSEFLQKVYTKGYEEGVAERKDIVRITKSN